MKLQTVKNIVIGAVCAVLAAGNIYQHVRVPEDASKNIVFYALEADNNSSAADNAYAAENLSISGDSDNSSVDNGLIDLNSATAEELMSLPGIGRVKAKAIIEYRKTYGRFVAAEEIMEVRGIGKATYEKIKDRITVR